MSQPSNRHGHSGMIAPTRLLPGGSGTTAQTHLQLAGSSGMTAPTRLQFAGSGTTAQTRLQSAGSSGMTALTHRRRGDDKPAAALTRPRRQRGRPQGDWMRYRPAIGELTARMPRPRGDSLPRTSQRPCTTAHLRASSVSRAAKLQQQTAWCIYLTSESPCRDGIGQSPGSRNGQAACCREEAFCQA